MAYLPSFLLLAAVYLVALASPGPAFFVISQLSLSGQRRRACLVAAGIATGSVLWASAALAGLAALLLHAGGVALVLRLAGAAYLAWFGLKLILRARSEPATAAGFDAAAPASDVQAYRSGLVTSFTNPKSGVFWTSVFATTLPAGAPGWVGATAVALVAVLSAGWHLGLACLFTTRRVQAAYRRLRRGLDAVCGLALLLLGAKLAFARN